MTPLGLSSFRTAHLVLPALALSLCAGCAATLEASASAPPPPPPVSATVTVGAEAQPPPPAPDAYNDTDPTALQDFHPALDAHGAWVDDPVYGTVWVPNRAEVGVDFVPYGSGGHWVYGDDYVWASDYEWGWAPFHYGRWVLLDGRGWSWIPGRQYAPAWVEWRTGDAYVGWAPAPPMYVWRGGVAVTAGFQPPPPRYVFCPHAEVFSPTPARVIVTGPRALQIQAHTQVFVAPGGAGPVHPGPPPATLGIPPARVAHATGHEPGLDKAQGFAHPDTAERLGAHPPAARVAATASPGQRPDRGPEPNQGVKPQERAHRDRDDTRPQTGHDAAREPARAEGARAEPAHVDPARPDPGRTGPGRAEPERGADRATPERAPAGQPAPGAGPGPARPPQQRAAPTPRKREPEGHH